MHRKKISSNQLKEYIEKKDLSNLDLSDIDLSQYPSETWNDCIFYNTDLRRTNIQFDPCLTHSEGISFIKYSLAYCDLGENPLTSMSINLSLVKVIGANLNSPNITAFLDFYGLIDLTDTVLPSSTTDLSTTPLTITITENTLKNNPQTKFKSADILSFLKKKLPSWEKILTDEEIKNWLEYCLDILQFDKSGALKELYVQIQNILSPIEKLHFFRGVIDQKEIPNLQITLPIVNILNEFQLNNNTFTSPTFRLSFKDLISLPYQGIFINNQVISPQFPLITPSSWQEITDKYAQRRRIQSSQYTFRTSVYVELSRDCPCHCSFCRNNSYDYCQYDFNQLEKTFTTLVPYVQDIVIGGGEPTIKMNHIYELKQIVDKLGCYPNFTIFTNGLLSPKEMQRALDNGMNINLSRHAVSDEENAKVFGVSSQKIISGDDLKVINSANITLCPTLFQGGLDSARKLLQYIIFAQNNNISHILFQTLHQDASQGNKSFNEPTSINPNELEKVKKVLLSYNYTPSLPIYSATGYKLTIFKKGNMTITFKEYISEKELDTKWANAVKRTFDLSIAPDGKLYENWNQQSNPILSLKKANLED